MTNNILFFQAHQVKQQAQELIKIEAAILLCNTLTRLSNFTKSSLVAVVFDLVVAAKCDQSSCSQSVGEEKLSTSLHPNLKIKHELLVNNARPPLKTIEGCLT